MIGCYVQHIRLFWYAELLDMKLLKFIVIRIDSIDDLTKNIVIKSRTLSVRIDPTG